MEMAQLYGEECEDDDYEQMSMEVKREMQPKSALFGSIARQRAVNMATEKFE